MIAEYVRLGILYANFMNDSLDVISLFISGFRYSYTPRSNFVLLALLPVWKECGSRGTKLLPLLFLFSISMADLSQMYCKGQNT